MTGRVFVVVVVVVAVGAIATLPSAATAQEKRRPERERGATRLWQLYPLDPEANGKPQEVTPETSTPSPLPSRQPPVDRSDSSRTVTDKGEAANRESPGLLPALPLFVVAGITLIILTLLVGLLLLRRQRRKEGKSPTIPVREMMPSPQRTKGASVESVRDREEPRGRNLVLVHLRDGRVIRGRLKQPASTDRPVLLIDIVDASDAEGRPDQAKPTDAFVPIAEIERIEGIDEDGPFVSPLARR
jgi:hypothetical protein